jgi:AcrR family transcriptional regulator
MNVQTNSNLNDVRSQATKTRLVNSAIDSLVEVGFTRTTGVEVCRRAQLTRGALNHHFPDIVELFISALHSVYDNFLQAEEEETQAGRLESFVLQGHSHISKPEFKAVIELWLASRNDPQFGSRLAAAIADGSTLFTPEAVLANGKLLDDPQFNAISDHF